MAKSINLKKLMGVLREEIKDAASAIKKDNQGVRIGLSEIQIELETVITVEGESGVKFKVLAFEAGGGGKISKASTQKFLFKLTVADDHGNEVEVNRESRHEPYVP